MTPRPLLSPHALQRMDEMKLTRADILTVLEDYEIDYASARPDTPNARVACRGKVAVAYDPHPRGTKVITVLWHVQDQYGRPA